MSGAIEDRIRELAPWHLEVEVAPGVTTTGGTGPTSEHVSFIAPRKEFRSLVLSVFPDGLEGRSFLDCACNCGGYSFWARELGASRCYGFDVREHWIAQAQFLQKERGEDGVTFERRDLYDLEGEPYDVTLFKGILYHLPDPMSGLKRAADLTKEVLILDTATRNDFPEDVLVVDREGTEALMSGVHGLNWFPGGPKAVQRILEWLGFGATRIGFWRRQVEGQPAHLGRMEILAAREERTFEAYDQTHSPATMPR